MTAADVFSTIAQTKLPELHFTNMSWAKHYYELTAKQRTEENAKYYRDKAEKYYITAENIRKRMYQ